MTRRDAILVGCVVIAGAFAVQRLLAAGAEARDAGIGGVHFFEIPQPVSRDSIARLVAGAIRRAPFRNEPLIPVIDAQEILSSAAMPGSPLPPDVTLRAVTGGPPWLGVLRGVPGVSGDVVVRPGDRHGELQVVSLAAQEMVLRWLDTTWTIRLTNGMP